MGADTAALSQSQLATIEEAIDYARQTGQPLPSPFGLRAELQRQADAFLPRLDAAEANDRDARASLEALNKGLEALNNRLEEFEHTLETIRPLRSQLLMELAGRNAECRIQAILEDFRDRVRLVTKFAYSAKWSEADRAGVDFVIWPHNCRQPLELQVKASEFEGRRFLDEQTLASIEHELDPRTQPSRYIRLIVVAGKSQRQLQKEVERVLRDWKQRYPLHAP